jgi:hypothetical protein
MIMRLTNKQKEYYKSMGWGEDDIAQLQEMGKYCKLTVCLEPNGEKIRRITQKEAIEILGKETFMSGMERACFHWTASRQNEAGTLSVDFNNSSMFK